ncbi:hypothetical protein GCM10009616_35870 [Microlunatus lacustris]
MISDRVGTVDFPTLGDLVDGWITQHCRIPDGFKRRQPFIQYDWQFWCTANHYRVREEATYDPANPPLNQAFTYARTDVFAAQKTGKGPWAACLTANMGVGPDLFCGWAKKGDRYLCSDHGCSCGWIWDYEPGEPMGTRHPSPLIQILATSQEQVGNIWRPLTAMIKFHGSPLGKLLLPREEFIRIVGENDDDPELDRIDAVTSSAKSRLGNPISAYVQDETGTYTKTSGMDEVASTQRRGAAGMQGRGFTTSNAWDPSQQSQGQLDYESNQPDVFTFYREPPSTLSFHDRRQRRKLLEFVYEGSSHINIDSIMAECDKMMLNRPAEAERFFGNRVVQGAGSWLPDGLWDKAYAGALAS